MKHRAFFTPAYPAAWLLFGMLFGLAAAYFLAASWSKTATAVIYTVPLVWVALVAQHRPETLRGLNRIDILFAVFILMVLTSLTVVQGGRKDIWKLLSYMPFMMLVPYVCGRFMRAADIDLFSRITLMAGITILPLLLVDRYRSAGQEMVRWPFFGQDHGALLVGALLATALIALCVRALACRNSGERNNRLNQLVRNGLIGVITVFLVWVTARGWLLAGLLGVMVVCWGARDRAIVARGGLFAMVLGIAALSLVSLPYLDPIFGSLYSMPLESLTIKSAGHDDAGEPLPMPLELPTIKDTKRDEARQSISMPSELPTIKDAERDKARQPILGQASCQPIIEGVNSIAIRLVLYREAIAMFLENPVFGVGAARFGEQSCVGVGLKSFPHSTVLQAFAELGVIGGSLLVGLMILAAISLVRRVMPSGANPNQSTDLFALALFVTFFVADQIYGNYFMSVGTWLMLGMVAGMEAEDKDGGTQNV